MMVTGLYLCQNEPEMTSDLLSRCYPQLDRKLIEEMERESSVKDFLAGEYIVKQGQYIRHLPIILEGTVKVFSLEEDIQFLLYYISSGGSCIYSFAHISNDEPATFSAKAESDSQLLLLPKVKVDQWLKQYPAFSGIVLSEYQKHYQDLLNTTKQIICHNLEERLVKHLKEKVKMANSTILRVSHQDLANDLGTSREVITRLMKKLSLSDKVQQVGRKIKVL